MLKRDNKRFMTVFASITLTISAMILIWQLSQLSWDGIDLWLKIASGVLAGLLFFFGIGTIISGYYLSLRQEEKNKTLEQNNNQLQLQIEKEKITRIQLEESLEPRTLISNRKATERLMVFSGTPFIIEYVPDAEVARAASQIKSALNRAGWREVKSVTTTSADEGVWIGTMKFNPKVDSTTIPAKELLIQFLEANGWKAENDQEINISNTTFETAINGREIPNGTVRIKIGIKPAPYFVEKITAGVLNEQAQESLKEYNLDRKAQIDKLRLDWDLPPRLP